MSQLSPQRVEELIAELDRGETRVAERVDGDWRVNEEAQRAILEYFQLRKMEPREVGPFGITINTLAPGLTMTEAVGLHHSEEQIERSRSSRAIARDEVPADLEGALAFLACDDSNFMTGQMLVVNGGAQFW